MEIVNAFDGLAPPSASTCATSSSSALPCNVFINHRGPDVKHKLATDIYNALHSMGLNVFLDSHDLHLGDFFPSELQQALSSSSLHVAIFSPTYAKSPWCLAELSFMLKTGTPIIPIFYRVQPEDLRHLKGIYADSFSEYEKKGRYIDKLEEWKKALRDVSFYKGESVNNEEEERRVLKNIVNRVLEVTNIVPLKLTKYPVGLEELVADFEMTVSQFTQLLEELKFKVNHQPFNNIEQGKNILSNYLRSVPVFIVLDDVDHPEQLEALLPAKDSLARESLVIVTTQDKDVLRPSPILGYEDLVENFVNVSNGLPLSLKVVGAQLYGRFNKDLWKELSHKISRILPSDIINRLRISYDALDREEKQMFLDVSCFFIGQDKMTATAVWEGSGWSGQWGWESLVNKCLVDLDNNNKIKMHDHLRDLGRDIARTLSPYRLWSPDQFMDISKQEEIRGIILNTATDDVHKFPGSLWQRSMWLCGFKIPYELKVFVVGEKYGNYLHIAKSSRELTLLSCTGLPQRNLPSWMSLKNLRVLELHGCHNIAGLWKDGVEAPVELRVLIISSCWKLQSIPKSIGYLKNLKKISLSHCAVKSLPEEFCSLQSLEHLQLKYCDTLSSLPSCFGHLTDLRHLDLSYCKALKMLPDSCKHLTLLQHFDLEGCQSLTLQ
ncbi:disease resistance protein RUN1-like [Cryptomeria japonica]|uniref:disease resistance protein RUN1-like n=1 Tax=Cryptomeria japonica TaxID=3369 RepID=UPI0027DAAC62|nr:disease resistance protein RUN1-like [Cryptomeria japonica]